MRVRGWLRIGLATGLLGGLVNGCAHRPPPPAVVTPPAPPVAIAPVYYTLHIEGRGLPAEILLNDVIVDRVEALNRSSTSLQVNTWVQPGRNRLRVHRIPGGDPAVDGPPALSVQLTREHPEKFGDGVSEEVAAVEWTSAAKAPDEQREFEATPPPPSELWTRALPVAIDDESRRAITTLTVSLEAALGRRDLDGAGALLGFKTSDIARAQFISPDEARASQRDQLDNVLRDKGFAIDRLDPRTLQFELVGGGRLIRVSRASGPAVQARLSQGGRFVLTVYAAKIGDAWTIAR